MIGFLDKKRAHRSCSRIIFLVIRVMTKPVMFFQAIKLR